MNEMAAIGYMTGMEDEKVIHVHRTEYTTTKASYPSSCDPL